MTGSKAEMTAMPLEKKSTVKLVNVPDKVMT